MGHPAPAVDRGPSIVSPADVLEQSDAAPAAHGDDPSGTDLVRSLAAATGLLLVLLLAIHVASIFLRDPETVDVGFLIDRWEDPWWLLADWGFLLVGTTHALLAFWRAASAPPPGARVGRDARRVACAVLGTLAVALFLAASRAMLLLV
jgi:succinate dehydrogenase hydrophobic anchor subunit